MATLVHLNYDQAHDYVDRMQRQKKSVVKWNGWDIEVFTPHSRAYFQSDGVYRNGKWGFMKTISPSDDGTWGVHEHSRGARN